MPKPLACARQRRHDTTHGYAHDVGDLVSLSAGSPMCTANLARAFAVSGRRNEAEQILGDLKKRSRPGYSNAAEIAVVYAALGDNDQAMTWLEKGYEERFNPSVLLRPGFDPLRADRRFQNVERRVGLSR